MVRNNTLKIYILATEAKPGGNIGAMLSPYLFSNNMNDFCKKYNEMTKDYLNTVWLPVILHTDIIEKLYTFYIKDISVSMLILDYYENNGKLTISFIYDLSKYKSKTYLLNIYNTTILILSIIKSFIRRFWKITLFEEIEEKVYNVL